MAHSEPRTLQRNSTPPHSTFDRDRIAMLLALITVGVLALTLVVSDGTRVLMPGPLASAHGTIEKCSSCHSASGSDAGTSKLSWVRGLVTSTAHSDSKACIACHKMPDTALNPHGASASILQRSTERLRSVAANVSAPQSLRAQSIAFPTHVMVSNGVECASCHQEHRGSRFKLNNLSDAQCQSCHVEKFASFDRDHPEFENYPFRRRTRIVYDHDSHFNKHYPEVAKKDPAKRIPETCSTCHNSRDDKRLMTVAPFDKTCATCHLDQIAGKERASGPKGVAFLTLPGVDVQSLKSKNAAIGDWPEGSDATLTPFMKVMIGRTERGRALLKAIAKLNLQDLTQTNADGIKTVTNLVWEVKSIFRDLISGKARDVLGDLNLASGAKLSSALVADLTANIPRDVVISAQQQWLPNLASEMAAQKVSGDKADDAWTQYVAIAPPSKTSLQAKAVEASEKADASAQQDNAGDKRVDGSSPDDNNKRDGERKKRLDPPACTLRVLGQCLVSKEPSASAGDDATSNQAKGSKSLSSDNTLPPAMRAGLRDAGPAAAEAAQSAQPGAQKVAANETQQPIKQDDELLRPTADEQLEIDARKKGGAKGTGTGDANASTPEAAPVISIDSSVDPESWAETGGWYRQDFAILYRPSGHKDKFIYSWLFLTGPQAAKGDESPATAVFEALTHNDAQGACTKCHSVDDLQSKGRIVNFTPLSLENKKGLFTSFVHEPHFGTVQKEGCFNCHSLEKGRPYLKSYEQGNPLIAAANFAAVKKDVCQTCHTAGAARNDCTTCHKYHVNGAQTPMMNTKLPMH